MLTLRYQAVAAMQCPTLQQQPDGIACLDEKTNGHRNCFCASQVGHCDRSSVFRIRRALAVPAVCGRREVVLRSHRVVTQTTRGVTWLAAVVSGNGRRLQQTCQPAVTASKEATSLYSRARGTHPFTPPSRTRRIAST